MRLPILGSDEHGQRFFPLSAIFTPLHTFCVHTGTCADDERHLEQLLNTAITFQVEPTANSAASAVKKATKDEFLCPPKALFLVPVHLLAVDLVHLLPVLHLASPDRAQLPKGNPNTNRAL